MSFAPLFFLLAISYGGGSAVTNDNYRISVTREDSNLYRVLGKDLYIETRYCYEYVYGENSLLKMSGRIGEIVFLDAGEKCDVAGVYGKSEVKAGTYSVTVSHSADGWYEIAQTGGRIRSNLCLSLSLSDRATLRMRENGFGRLYFSNERECSVEGVYDRLTL